MRVLILILTFILVPCVAYAESSFKYEFANDYIQSLSLLKGISDRAEEMDRWPEDMPDNDRTFKTLTQAHRAVLVSKNATNRMQAYLEEEKLALFEEEIQDFVLTIALVFQEIDKLYEKHVQVIEGMKELQLKVSNEGDDAIAEGQKDLVALVSAGANITASLEEGYHNLFFTAAVVGNMLFDADRDKEKAPVLGMTEAEKVLLLEELELVFGTEVKEGMKSGQSYLAGAGPALYMALNKDWPVKSTN